MEAFQIKTVRDFLSPGGRARENHGENGNRCNKESPPVHVSPSSFLMEF
jgi:hypothetical protein